MAIVHPSFLPFPWPRIEGERAIARLGFLAEFFHEPRDPSTSFFSLFSFPFPHLPFSHQEFVSLSLFVFYDGGFFHFFYFQEIVDFYFFCFSIFWFFWRFINSHNLLFTFSFPFIDKLFIVFYPLLRQIGLSGKSDFSGGDTLFLLRLSRSFVLTSDIGQHLTQCWPNSHQAIGTSFSKTDVKYETEAIYPSRDSKGILTCGETWNSSIYRAQSSVDILQP